MSGILRRYEEWFKKNSSWFGPVEDAMRAMTVFLPGRFSTSELETESVYTALNLLSLYHDRILDKPQNPANEVKCGVETGSVRTIKNVHVFLRYIEVLAEMVGRRYYNDQDVTVALGSRGSITLNGKLAIVIVIETLKALCRLFMLVNNGGRMLMIPTVEELAAAAFHRREVELAASAPPVTLWTADSMVKSEVGLTSPYKGTARAASQALSTPSTPKSGGAASPSGLPLVLSDLYNMYVLHGRSTAAVITQGGAGHPHGRFSAYTNPAKFRRSHDDEVKELTYQPSLLQVLSELLNILRPVLYVIMQVPALSRHSPWRPFFASAISDIVSRLLAGGNFSGNLTRLTAAQKMEVHRRVSLWWYYLVRNPIFDLATKPALERVRSLVTRVPLIGGLFEAVFELIYILQTYHFYTSASS